MFLTFVLARRYAIAVEQTRFTRVVSVVAVTSLMLGVASLIVVLSVMNGFAQELHGRLLSVIPHGFIKNADGPLRDWESLAERIAGHPEVTMVGPVLQDTVLLHGWGESRGASLKGIPVATPNGATALQSHVIDGDIAPLAATPFTIALGAGLARLLAVRVGDQVDVTLPTLSVSPFGIFPRKRRLEVVAVFQVGTELDAQTAYVSLDTARRLLGRQGVDGVEYRVRNPEESLVVRQQLQQSLPATLELTDWRDSQGSLFRAIKLEKRMIALMLFAVVFVAAFNIVSMLTMSVTEKRRSIAVLRVLGVSRGQMIRVFIGAGLLIAGVGITLGAGVGIGLASVLVPFTQWLESAFGLYLFDPSVYYITRLPSVLLGRDVLMVVGVSLALCFFATLYPAWRAAGIQPAEVLNDE